MEAQGEKNCRTVCEWQFDPGRIERLLTVSLYPSAFFTTLTSEETQKDGLVANDYLSKYSSSVWCPVEASPVWDSVYDPMSLPSGPRTETANGKSLNNQMLRTFTATNMAAKTKEFPWPSGTWKRRPVCSTMATTEATFDHETFCNKCVFLCFAPII